MNADEWGRFLCTEFREVMSCKLEADGHRITIPTGLRHGFQGKFLAFVSRDRAIGLFPETVAREYNDVVVRLGLHDAEAGCHYLTRALKTQVPAKLTGAKKEKIELPLVYLELLSFPPFDGGLNDFGVKQLRGSIKEKYLLKRYTSVGYDFQGLRTGQFPTIEICFHWVEVWHKQAFFELEKKEFR